MSQPDKIVLITGTSSGIGEATARHLATLGYSVVLGARRSDRIEHIAGEIAAAGGTALALPLDVTDRASVQAWIDAAVRRFGRIDVLVNNAGVMPLSMMAEAKVDEWDRMIDVNLRGTLYAIGSALPIMEAQKSGHVINIASTAAHRVDPTAAVYCATKYAVRALSEGLRQESRHVRVTVVSPGFTRSELIEHTSSADIRAALTEMAKIGLRAQAIAEAIGFAIAQPADVDVNELIIRPTVQG